MRARDPLHPAQPSPAGDIDRERCAGGRHRGRSGAGTDLGRLLVLLDYDGTVTVRESNEIVFQHFVGDAWRAFEDAVQRGDMSHAECFNRQVGLVRAAREDLLAAAVAAAEPASGLHDFLGALAHGGARVAVVSAGYREAIEAVWRRESLAPVRLFASELVARDGRVGPPWRVVYDPALGDCPSCGPVGCKAAVARCLRRVGDAVAAFGDGVSDLCVAREADIVFARATLARLCAAEGIAYHPLDDFHQALAELLAWFATRDHA